MSDGLPVAQKQEDANRRDSTRVATKFNTVTSVNSIYIQSIRLLCYPLWAKR